jgi:leucyl/phenylalanyl-tRNA--protein transferase
LLDTQFLTGHLAQFGCEEVPRAAYKRLLAAAVEQEAAWRDPAPENLLAEIRAMREESRGA